jgi:uncharacterized protein YjiS (DUF1127 family)
MYYHLSLQRTPASRETQVVGQSRQQELHRTQRRERARANRLVGRFLSGAVAAVARLIRRELQASARRRAEAAAVRELQALSDRMLGDVGVTRGDIRSVARQMVDARGTGGTWQAQAASERATLGANLGAASRPAVAEVAPLSPYVEPRWRGTKSGESGVVRPNVAEVLRPFRRHPVRTASHAQGKTTAVLRGCA